MSTSTQGSRSSLKGDRDKQGHFCDAVWFPYLKPPSLCTECQDPTKWHTKRLCNRLAVKFAPLVVLTDETSVYELDVEMIFSLA